MCEVVGKNVFFFLLCALVEKKKRSRQGALIQGDNTMKYGSISLSLAHMHPQTHVFTVCNAHNLFFPTLQLQMLLCSMHVFLLIDHRHQPFEFRPVKSDV